MFFLRLAAFSFEAFFDRGACSAGFCAGFGALVARNQTVAQTLEGEFAVAILRAMLRCENGDARRDVYDAHSGFDFVAMLAARAAPTQSRYGDFASQRFDVSLRVGHNHKTKRQEENFPLPLCEGVGCSKQTGASQRFGHRVVTV